MKTNRYIQNSLYILTIFIITTIIISLSLLYINKEAYTQDNVYDNNIPPNLEGLSLNDTLEIIKGKLESRYIYQRYTRTINHMTTVDPYLLYSQRYYTQYYNDFIPTTLCNGQEYLVKFDDININNNSYQMYKKSDEGYYVLYNKLFSLTLKDEETIRRFNPLMNKQNGIRVDFYNNTVYRIIGHYKMNLDKLSATISEYNDIYGEHKLYSSGENRILRWRSNENTISMSFDLNTMEKLSFVDLYRGEDEFNENQIKIEIYNSSVNQDILRYKSDIYMDIVRNLSFEFKNKVDKMNYYLCQTE